MANVTVFDQVWRDLRFEALGELTGQTKYDAIARMARLWSQATDQGSGELSRAVVALVIDPDAVVAADLAECISDDKIRLRGVTGRIEWFQELSAKRSAAGRKGAEARWGDRDEDAPGKSTTSTTENGKSQDLPFGKMATTRSDPDRIGVDPEQEQASAAGPELDLAMLLAGLIAERSPGSKVARDKLAAATRWAPDIEKLHRIDGRGWEEIGRVIHWCQADSFWCGNILSGSKLRKQFDRLDIQMKSREQTRRRGPSREAIDYAEELDRGR